MATLSASVAFNGNDFNFNVPYSTAVYANHQIGANITVQDVFYSDYYSVVSVGGSRQDEYLGTGFTFDANQTITGGTVQLIATGLTDAATNNFYIAGLSIAATTLLHAAETASTADDYQIIGKAFSGADLITLSDSDDVAYGYAGGDLMQGNAGTDILYGGFGNDSLEGGAGADFLYGGAGNDSYYSDAGDHIVESAGGGIDTVFALVTTTLAANVENITLTGPGALSAFGNMAANHITGNSSANTLKGGFGADTLLGGGGADQLYGGTDSARDVFVYASTVGSPVGAGHDTIHDFHHGQDNIDLSLMDADTTLAGNQTFQFDGPFPKAHSIWITSNQTDSVLHADVNGDTVADFEVVILGITALAPNDFTL